MTTSGLGQGESLTRHHAIEAVKASGAAAGLAPVRQVLSNGVRVLAKETSTTPAITIHAAIRAGTIYDPPAELGISQFVARTLDRGTTTRSADTIAEDLDSRGVSLNVSINRHAISLVCTCLVEDFTPILSLLADVIVRPEFPQAEVETRRAELITMIRQDEDNPAAMASEGLMSLLYGSEHPYGRRPRGTVQSVEQITRERLRAFHAARFAASELSLAIVGDIDPLRAIDAASEAFDDWSGRSVEPVTLAMPPKDTIRRVRVIPMMNKAQADISYGFTSILRADPAYYSYWLMNNILGQYSIGGRLGDSIRERQGMAYYVFSALDANVVPGPLMIRAGVNPTNVERAVQSIDAELSRFTAEGPTDREMTESKQYLIGSMPRTLETNAAIATFLQTVEFFGLGLDYDVRMPGLLQAVTRDDVVAAARAVLDPSRAAVVVAGPYDGTLA
jgi:zinc protease